MTPIEGIRTIKLFGNAGKQSLVRSSEALCMRRPATQRTNNGMSWPARRLAEAGEQPCPVDMIVRKCDALFAFTLCTAAKGPNLPQLAFNSGGAYEMAGGGLSNWRWFPNLKRY